MAEIPPLSGASPPHVPPHGGQRHTVQTLTKLAREGQAFACLTCYDATTARWLARGGVPLLLVGDTAAEVILGLSRTIDMPLEVLLALTAAVKRGAPNCVVMGDMPFMSYQADDAEAIRNAGRFLTEGHADIVKVEADASYAPLIARMVRAGVPICGHVGSRPQLAALTSGYGAAGRTPDDAVRIVNDSRALEQAGCQMLLIEAVPPEVTRRVLDATSVPVIGIGAGTECHGQVVVLQDLVGMSEHPPAFVEPMAEFGRSLEEAAAGWVGHVAARRPIGRAVRMRAEAPRIAERAGADGRNGRAHRGDADVQPKRQ